MRLYITIAVVGCLCAIATFFVFKEIFAEPVREMPEEISADLSIEELFERGQYYFNHDDDKDGPYDLQKARRYYESILARDLQGHESTWHQLGRIDFLEGNFDAALYKFDKQIEYFDDRLPNVYYMIGLTYGFKARESNSEEDWKKGADAFKKFIEYEPESPWPRVDLSWIYFAQGKFKEMLPILEEGLLYSPESPWLHNMYGLALFNTGDVEGARTHFMKAQEFASQLTVTDWGRAYPGNNPAEWEPGLNSFLNAIEKNLELVQGK